jgi:hypothetical protein
MNSKTLIETGFAEWFPLKTLTHANLPSDKGSVIIIVDKELAGKPESDILYIGRIQTDKPRIMQEELLTKFKADHGELPIWNTKKKLTVKPKGTPAFKPKKAPALKTKTSTSKAMAAPVAKPRPKPKVASTKKPAAKAEAPAKMEMPVKEETAAEMPEKDKTSGSEMTT